MAEWTKEERDREDGRQREEWMKKEFRRVMDELERKTGREGPE